MAALARLLVEGNQLQDSIEIVESSLEESSIPGQVDIIVSEPIGFLLVHERMLESYVQARDMYLRPGGLMMPSNGTIICAPFTDQVSPPPHPPSPPLSVLGLSASRSHCFAPARESSLPQALWNEQSAKTNFWNAGDFYGIDLRPLVQASIDETFGQAVVGYFSTDCLLSSDRAAHTIDFQTVTLEELREFHIPVCFRIEHTALMHGIACWFDAKFLGSAAHVTLTTAPNSPGTHWSVCPLLNL